MANATANTDATQAHILRLPPELMENVAAHVPVEGLAGTQIDVQRHQQQDFYVSLPAFTDKTFLLAYPKSMQALVDISQHTVFGKCLKRVRLLTLEIITAREDEHTRGPSAVRKSRDDRRRHRETRQIHYGLSEEQRSYMQSSKWRHLLWHALTNYKANNPDTGICLEIDAIQNIGAPSPTGEKNLERKLGYQGCLAISSYPGPNLETTLWKVLLDAYCPVLELTMNASNIDVPLDFFNTNIPHNQGFAAAFDRMRKLDTSVHTPYNRGATLQDARQASMQAFADLLSKLSHLEVVVLTNRAYDWDEGNKLMKIISSYAYMPALQSLELHGSYTGVCDLVSFVSRHKHTLRALEASINPTDGRSMSLMDAEERIKRAAGDKPFELVRHWPQQW
ncbi:hypothetical protein LTR36_004444 [Oleoguttula mirabilis]|uniref:Uncharacterized protein n=1 Tax=Oleoguttula mirabilis TaxID=1507867 RepID=A0AAV9JGM2_9PEZI|nr:hypothetical protein LTR36_004444 [Oleoguttula mirabilis]